MFCFSFFPSLPDKNTFVWLVKKFRSLGVHANICMGTRKADYLGQKAILPQQRGKVIL